MTEPCVWHIAYDCVAPPPPQYALSKTGTQPVTIHLAAGSYTPGAVTITNRGNVAIEGAPVSR